MYLLSFKWKSLNSSLSQLDFKGRALDPPGPTCCLRRTGGQAWPWQPRDCMRVI